MKPDAYKMKRKGGGYRPILVPDGWAGSSFDGGTGPLDGP